MRIVEKKLIEELANMKKSKEEYENKINKCNEIYAQRKENDSKMKEYQQLIDTATKEYTDALTSRQMADKQIMEINKHQQSRKEIQYFKSKLQDLEKEEKDQNYDEIIKSKEELIEQLTKDFGMIEFDSIPDRNRTNQRIKELEEQKVNYKKKLNELNQKMAMPGFVPQQEKDLNTLF